MVSGGDAYGHGETVSIFATANPGWRFQHWAVNAQIVSENPEYAFAANNNSDLAAQFIEEQTGEGESEGEGEPDPQCGCFNGCSAKDAMTLDGMKRMLGDWFLLGLSLAALLALRKRWT